MLFDKKQKLKLPGINWLYKHGVVPNHLTITGLLLAITALFLPFLPAMSLFITSFLLDLYDGNLARKHKLKTSFGSFFDSTVDKIVETLFIYYTIILLNIRALGVLAAGLSIMISYIKHRSGLKLTSIFDRAERLIFLLIITFFFSNQAVLGFIIYITLCIIAIIQLLVKVRRRL